jgi:hypothetical protein
MHLMQYEITLPADYDMARIHDRVRERGHLLDGFDGLAFKAYAIRRRDHTGSPVNQYAPFYLWREVTGLSRFISGELFAGLCASFGRPAVRNWVVLDVLAGERRAQTPCVATRQLERLPADAQPSGWLDAARAASVAAAAAGGCCWTVLAVNPEHWELACFQLWSSQPSAGDGARYEVLHFSAPGTEELDRPSTANGKPIPVAAPGGGRR